MKIETNTQLHLTVSVNMYEFGKGVEKDLEKAAKLYQLSVDQGDARAKNNLGIYLQTKIKIKQTKKPQKTHKTITKKN